MSSLSAETRALLAREGLAPRKRLAQHFLVDKGVVARMIDLAIEQRSMAGILQRDPVMLRCLEEHERFRSVMARVNRALMGGPMSPRTRVQAAIVASAVAGAVLHPLGRDLDDRSLRNELNRQLRKLFPQRRTSPRGSGTPTSA